MATFEQAVRTMLTAGTTLSANPVPVPDSRVTHGYRLQTSALPAVTYSVDSKQEAELGAEIMQAQVTVNSIAATSADALSLAEKVRTALVKGTYDGLVFCAVMITNEMLEPETVGLGDEQEPATAMTVATIYWR